MGRSGLDRTDDFQKFCRSGLDRIEKFNSLLISGGFVYQELSEYLKMTLTRVSSH